MAGSTVDLIIIVTVEVMGEGEKVKTPQNEI